ncbi:helix-turn-helix domain-containing protein [Nocardia tenerifensis]|nr:helix-turn-helix domain-containing protein [Nocardia tenerifensis]
MKYAKVPHSLIDAAMRGEINGKTIMVYSGLAKFADGKTREAWPSRKTLASVMSCAQPEAADRYLRELEHAGFITRTQRFGDGRGSESPVRDEVYAIQLPNCYKLVWPPPDSPGGGGASAQAGVVCVATDEQEPLQQEPVPSHSRSAELTMMTIHVEPELLQDTWKPNHTHTVVCQRFGLDIDQLANDFRHRMFLEKRSDWDATFGRFINDFADQRDETTFSTYGPPPF